MLGAELVEHQTFEPIERIDDDRLVVVLLAPQVGQRRDHFVVSGGQRKLVAVDFVETVFGLDEDRLGRL